MVIARAIRWTGRVGGGRRGIRLWAIWRYGRARQFERGQLLLQEFAGGGGCRMIRMRLEQARQGEHVAIVGDARLDVALEVDGGDQVAFRIGDAPGIVILAAEVLLPIPSRPGNTGTDLDRSDIARQQKL